MEILLAFLSIVGGLVFIYLIVSSPSWVPKVLDRPVSHWASDWPTHERPLGWNWSRKHIKEELAETMETSDELFELGVEVVSSKVYRDRVVVVCKHIKTNRTKKYVVLKHSTRSSYSGINTCLERALKYYSGLKDNNPVDEDELSVIIAQLDKYIEES